MLRKIPDNRSQITDLFYSMRVYDVDGLLIGRVYFETSDQVTVLKPDGSTYKRTGADVQHSVRQRFWICDPQDPAVTGKWGQRNDVPEARPGQSFHDGHKVGIQDGHNLAEAFSEPPSWLHDDEPLELTGDEFNDGYRTGISTTLRDILLKRFKDLPPAEPEEKTWRNTKWGVDPLDPNAVASFQKGFEYSKSEKKWLPELNASQRINELFFAELESAPGIRLDRVAFSFGFKSGMESRFPHRY